RGVAERVFDQIQGFSGFGFPKSHSAAFGLLAYQSTWLRVHYAPELLCSLLNEQPMGFYPPDTLVHEAQRRGIEVRGPDVNESPVECAVEPNASKPAVRIGLGYVAEVAEAEVEALVAERERGGPYEDLADLAARCGAGAAALERLAWAGACDRLASAGPARRAPLWTLGGSATAQRLPEGAQLAIPLQGVEPPTDRRDRPLLPELEPWQRLVADYRSTGMTLGEHPMSLLRDQLSDRALASRDLERARDGARIELGGMVVARQRPATAKGVAFMLLEDEWGVINLVVPPPVAERDRLTLRTAGFVRAHGKLERREGVINLVVTKLEPLVRPGMPAAEVRTIEPPVDRETGRGDARDAGVVDLAQRRATAASELAAALPPAHSFGRRGR
ncbi:MAG: helix-hairpin-helix domain-containing protein, partial [Solirubrobacterales bacterium]